MSKALILGGVSFNTMIYVDQFPQPTSQTVFCRSFHETVGSSGAGKALNLHKLGIDTTLYAPIGDDYHGQLVREQFRETGVAFIFDIDRQGTRRHVNLMDASGGRISIFVNDGSAEFPVDVTRFEPLIAKSDFVALGLANYCRAFIPAIRRYGKKIWCDIHDYDGQNEHHTEFIEAADFIFMSSAALPKYRSFMERLVRDGKKLVVCTHGAHGATALTQTGQWFETPIMPGAILRDSNGAGDAFFAGFIYGHSHDYTIKKCLQMGAVAAGMCIGSAELASPLLTAHSVETAHKLHFGQ